MDVLTLNECKLLLSPTCSILQRVLNQKCARSAIAAWNAKSVEFFKVSRKLHYWGPPFKRGVLMCRTLSAHRAAVLWGPGDKRQRGLWTCDRGGRTAIPFQVCFSPPAGSSKQSPTWRIKARHQHFVLLRFRIISSLFMRKGIWQC